MFIKKLKIGNVELDNNVILAPMAGVTDLAFRKICKEQGCGLVCCEMVSSRAIVHGDDKTLKMINMDGEKRPVAIQIFGNEPDVMAKSAEYLSNMADIIDINMGCPAPKVVKNGDGSKLLLNLDLIGEIVESVVKASKVPVTVKIRKGWDDNNIVAVEVAKIVEKLGVSAITVHGRTRSEFYSGRADLDIIKKVKDVVSIPVIGNGDIVDEESALRMFEYTGVDGIMCGRGVLGNPWLFSHIISYLRDGVKLSDESKDEKFRIIKKHFELLLDEKGEYTAVREMRKHIAWYVKNMPDASKMRCKINTIEDKKEFIISLEEFFK